MGLFNWLKGSKSSELVPSEPKTASRPNWMAKPKPKPKVTMSAGYSPLVKLAGTTTNSQEAAVALVQRYDLADRVALYVTGTLQREPENTYDADAVAVLVEGERIDYLPSYTAKDLSLGVGSSVTIPLQLFCADLGTRLRVEAFAWLGDEDPQWKYSDETPPAMSTEQKRMSAHKTSSGMVRTALAKGGTRAE